MALLQMQNISKSFYGIPANEDVSLQVEKGEIHALLGENGAGKTTLMNILYGIYQRDAGQIFWKDEEVRFQSPKEALENRIGMVHQHFMLVPTLTVSENITLGLKNPGHPFTRRKELNRSIRELSEKYGLDINPEAYVRDLSVGEEQRVEIMKLLYRNAELLILDEPTAVLTPQETESFFSILNQLKSEGHAVILITHRIPEVLAVTDKITVLRDGRNSGDLVTRETDSRELSHMMIGRELKENRPERRSFSSEESVTCLELSRVNCFDKAQQKLRDISFTLRDGEILGLAGVDGNGQKELAECIAGIRKASSGEILIKDENVSTLPVAKRFKKGLAYISDDRHNDGLVLDMNLEENFILNTQNRETFSSRLGLLNAGEYRRAAEQAVSDFNIKTSGTGSPIGLLSGGNQQKLILAREFYHNPSVVIAFQPTRGLDIGAAGFIREELVRLREGGCSIILISTDLDEILSLSDRIAVMFEGSIPEIVENSDDIDLTRIGELMAGHVSTREPQA